LAQKPPKGPDARAVTNEALQTKVDIDVRDFFVRLQNRSTELLADGQQRGLTGEALADFVAGGTGDLSEAPINLAGRAATSEAYNLGRNLEAQRRLPEIGPAVRSALLDERTCDNCIALDLAVVEVNGPVVSIKPEGADLLRQNGVDPDSPDAYFALMPPNFCLGEDFCRDEFLYRRAAA
jgi:hypothetical protein